MLKRFFAYLLFVNCLNVFSFSQINSLDLSSIEESSKEVIVHNNKMKSLKKAVKYSLYAAVAYSAGKYTLQAKGWASEKYTLLSSKPMSLQAIKSAFSSNVQDAVSTVEELSKKVKHLEDIASSNSLTTKTFIQKYWESLLLNGFTSVVLNSVIMPTSMKFLYMKSFSWAFKGIDNDFNNCKMAAINVCPNSAVIVDISISKNVDDQEDQESEAKSISDKELLLKLKSVALNRLSMEGVSPEVKEILAEAFVLNFNKVIQRLHNLSAVLVSIDQKDDALRIIKFTNAFVSKINTELASGKDFDLLAHIVGFENGVTALYNTL